LQQTDPTFAFEDDSVDFFAAFSVFTHMEPEDCYRYLRDARRVVRERGRFVLSCLTLDLQTHRRCSCNPLLKDFEARWALVRNVTTTYDAMTAVAKLAGWQVRRWYRGDRAMIPSLREPGERVTLGQSVCILEPAPLP